MVIPSSVQSASIQILLLWVEFAKIVGVGVEGFVTCLLRFAVDQRGAACGQVGFVWLVSAKFGGVERCVASMHNPQQK